MEKYKGGVYFDLNTKKIHFNAKKMESIVGIKILKLIKQTNENGRMAEQLN